MRKNHVTWLSFAAASIISNLSPSIAGESQSSTPSSFIAVEKELLPYCQELRYANRFCRRKQKHWECFDHAVVKLPNREFPLDFPPTCTNWDIENIQSFCEVWTDAGPDWVHHVETSVHGQRTALDRILKLWKRNGSVRLESGALIEPWFLCLQEKVN